MPSHSDLSHCFYYFLFEEATAAGLSKPTRSLRSWIKSTHAGFASRGSMVRMYPEECAGNRQTGLPRTAHSAKLPMVHVAMPAKADIQ